MSSLKLSNNNLMPIACKEYMQDPEITKIILKALFEILIDINFYININ